MKTIHFEIGSKINVRHSFQKHRTSLQNTVLYRTIYRENNIK